MYAGSSEQYWKQQRTKSHPLKSPRNIFIFGFILLLSVAITLRSNARQRHEEQQRILLAERMTRPTATEENYRVCETNMRDALRIECDEICSSEAKSVPRPTMYSSCHHGCSRSFYSAAIVGCREGSETEALTKINGESHSSCSRYMNVNPRPSVQLLCKKYYNEGIERGWKLGNEFIDNILQMEWDKKMQGIR